MDKVYGFRLSTDDDDIRKRLEALPDGERSRFVKNALRFYLKYCDEISKTPIAPCIWYFAQNWH